MPEIHLANGTRRVVSGDEQISYNRAQGAMQAAAEPARRDVDRIEKKQAYAKTFLETIDDAILPSYDTELTAEDKAERESIVQEEVQRSIGALHFMHLAKTIRIERSLRDKIALIFARFEAGRFNAADMREFYEPDSMINNGISDVLESDQYRRGYHLAQAFRPVDESMPHRNDEQQAAARELEELHNVGAHVQTNADWSGFITRAFAALSRLHRDDVAHEHSRLSEATLSPSRIYNSPAADTESPDAAARIVLADLRSTAHGFSTAAQAQEFVDEHMLLMNTLHPDAKDAERQNFVELLLELPDDVVDPQARNEIISSLSAAA